ncbi:DUF4183 domain-containing protein [Bacillus massilinigeriensis]|uniref:DUF4183 domain-containing protein n=1 Tax=Bacillus massilionigeriensis TaxID=1805475 RepID=UPI00096B1EA5|nr:DUF4183 domain-containing protein [Bacillus massilionigeriensis]
MVLRIFKLAISSENKISLSPTITRLFHVTSEPIAELSTHKISTTQFFNDSGEIVQALPELNMDNSYFNVYINGVLQMENIFSYTAGEEGIGSLLISVPEGSEIEKGTPIILEIVNFNPTVKTTHFT